MRPVLVGAFLIAAGLAADCNDPVQCTAQFVYGLTINVTDSVTNAPMGQGTVVVVKDGAYVDSVLATYGNTFQAAGERAGVYSVLAHHANYRDWIRTGVRVTRNQCHVNPVVLTAKLQPSP